MGVVKIFAGHVEAAGEWFPLESGFRWVRSQGRLTPFELGVGV